MIESERKYIIAFSTVPGIGPARLKLLHEYFESYQSAWTASEPELTMVGLPKNICEELVRQRSKLNVDQYVDNVQKRGIKFVTILDGDYPGNLRNISDPPNILYLRSSWSVKDLAANISRTTIAVVGTRKMTSYGQEVTKHLVGSLALSGCTIVSGMALGIDGVAHKTCLDLSKPTVAVLGAGVDIIYPPQHAALYRQIVDKGAVVSEVAPEKLVGKGIFPARNRIISGLAAAVLVTEGDLDSGSLITAKLALEQGREVFAVPGAITSPLAKGTNYLLKEGATMVTDVDDILDRLGISKKAAPVIDKEPPKGRNKMETVIIDCLCREPLTIDEISRQTGITVGEVAIVVSKMELDGLITANGESYSLA